MAGAGGERAGRHVGRRVGAVQRVAQHERQEVHQRDVAALRQQHRHADVPVAPVAQRACHACSACCRAHCRLMKRAARGALRPAAHGAAGRRRQAAGAKELLQSRSSGCRPCWRCARTASAAIFQSGHTGAACLPCTWWSKAVACRGPERQLDAAPPAQPERRHRTPAAHAKHVSAAASADGG